MSFSSIDGVAVLSNVTGVTSSAHKFRRRSNALPRFTQAFAHGFGQSNVWLAPVGADIEEVYS